MGSCRAARPPAACLAEWPPASTDAPLICPPPPPTLPRCQVAYAATGEASPALLGFCKKNGVTGEPGLNRGERGREGWESRPVVLPLFLWATGSSQAALAARAERERLPLLARHPFPPLIPLPSPPLLPPFAVEDCFNEADAKGVEYVWAEVKQVGRCAAEVLTDELPALVGGLSFKKSMRWRPDAGGCASRSSGQPAAAAVVGVGLGVVGWRTRRMREGHRAQPAGVHAVASSGEASSQVSSHRLWQQTISQPGSPADVLQFCAPAAHLPAAFSRPLRWLLALHGDTVLPFSYAGLQAGACTGVCAFRLCMSAAASWAASTSCMCACSMQHAAGWRQLALGGVGVPHPLGLLAPSPPTSGLPDALPQAPPRGCCAMPMPRSSRSLRPTPTWRCCSRGTLGEGRCGRGRRR